MTTSANGTVALIGAGEYLPAIAAVDQMLLKRVNGTPRVVVLPTAATLDGPEVTQRWARMGVEHFTQIGASVEPVMLLDRAHAEDAAIVAQLAAANFIYLSGGKPRYLLETLQGTAAWRAILNVFTAGGVIAGCSAGAMVLGSLLFDFPRLWHTIPALNLAPNIAIIPHFNELPPSLTGTLHRAANKVTVAGIDGSTALVGSGKVWTVLGSGSVTIFNGNKKTRYRANEQVPLQALE